MSSSEDETAAGVGEQSRRHWNDWNTASREHGVGQVSEDQSRVILGWIRGLRASGLRLLDVGCGTGWFTSRLTSFGPVVATDLADEVVARAQQRVPAATFVAGDFTTLDLGSRPFDVVVSLEVLSHIPDQVAFVDKLADLLVPGGYLMLATQNRPVLQRNDVPPTPPGALRHWVDRQELRALLERRFDVLELTSVTPTYNRGPLHVLNSRTAERWSRRIGLAPVVTRLRTWEERHFLGWTLMALARRRLDPSGT